MCCSSQQPELQRQGGSCISEVRVTKEEIVTLSQFSFVLDTTLFCCSTVPQIAQCCHVSAGEGWDGQTAAPCQN